MNRHLANRLGLLSLLAALLLTACTTSASRGGVLTADARALRYGASGPEILNNPEIGGKVRALFGPDWNPGGAVTLGAPAFFPATSSIRLVRIDGADFIAVSGCVSGACASDRGLLLIRQDAEQLLARLDEGGFSHYYSFGPGATMGPVPQPWIDGAWRIVDAMDRG
jgi:hypothetical protein